MKIKDLLEELKKYPEDAEVLVDGYEGGYTSAKAIKVIRHLRTVELWQMYYGEYVEGGLDPGNLLAKELTKIEAVLLPRSLT